MAWWEEGLPDEPHPTSRKREKKMTTDKTLVKRLAYISDVVAAHDIRSKRDRVDIVNALRAAQDRIEALEEILENRHMAEMVKGAEIDRLRADLEHLKSVGASHHGCAACRLIYATPKEGE